MKITKVETIPLEVPLISEPFYGSRGNMFYFVQGTANFFVTKIYTDEGIIGQGESSFQGYKPENLLVDVHIAPLLIGEDPFNITRIHAKVNLMEMTLAERYDSVMHSAMTAIDIALWDIIGQALNRPIYQLLGGAVRDKVPFGAYTTMILSVEDTLKRMRNAYKDGYRVMRMKVGHDDDLDIARVKAIREEFGDDVKIWVDANQAWTVHRAISVLKKMDRHGLDIVEQPVAYYNLKGMAQVRKATGIQVMADESLHTPFDALNIIKEEAADIFNIYVNKSPGITYSMRIARIAEAAGIDAHIAGQVASVGEVAKLHMIAAIPNIGVGAGVGKAYEGGLTENLLAEQPKVTKDGVELPKGPGLGIRLDEEKLKKYRREGLPKATYGKYEPKFSWYEHWYRW